MSVKRNAILVCSLGVLSSCAGDLLLGAAQSSGTGPKVQTVLKTPKDESELTFKTGNAGEVETKDGVSLGFTEFTASDGVGLRVFYLRNPSPSQAQEAFNKELATAVKVAERGAKQDRNGKVVGERARILVRATKPFHPFSAVIWTEGPTFREITSGSSRHALEFEKVYRY